jgi:hypothetical protein
MRIASKMWLLAGLLWLVASPVLAQEVASGPSGQPPSYPSSDLDRLVGRIALYPDPLLAHVLTAATYPAEISDAARWADEHHHLNGSELTDAIAEDQLPWDPSVQSLLSFPVVLDMMASDPAWTQDLGNAFLAQNADVMDAVQRMRQRAWRYGYLRSGPRVLVRSGPFIEIVPVEPAFIVVPSYDPLIVFGPPRPRFAVAGGVYWGFGVRLGTWWDPWGWNGSRVMWSNRAVLIDNAPWRRTWYNRGNYVHPFVARRYVVPRRPVEQHRVAPRTDQERQREHGRPERDERKSERDRRPEREDRM